MPALTSMRRPNGDSTPPACAPTRSRVVTAFPLTDGNPVTSGGVTSPHLTSPHLTSPHLWCGLPASQRIRTHTVSDRAATQVRYGLSPFGWQLPRRLRYVPKLRLHRPIATSLGNRQVRPARGKWQPTPVVGGCLMND